MAEMGLRVMSGHLDYLSPQLVTFALADLAVRPDEAEELAKYLWSIRNQWVAGKPSSITVPGPNFVTSPEFWPADGSRPRLVRFGGPASFQIFEIIGQTADDLVWMSRPHQEWKDSLSYQRFASIAYNTSSINDAAERGVQLSQRQTGKVGKEENLLDTIIVVEEERNRMPKKKGRKWTKAEVMACVRLNDAAGDSSDDGGE
jgi:hypothetical protein